MRRVPKIVSAYAAIASPRFHPPDALAEFARILKRGQRLAIMWNRRSKADPLTAAYRQAMVDVAGQSGAESMSFDREVVARSGLFTAPDR